MAENSNIEWTDATFNPWRGCQRVSPGCERCYAETMSKRNPGVLGTWGPQGTRVVAAESYWRQPVKWDREAKAAGQRRRVFCASLADVFEDWRGSMHATNGNPLWWCYGSLSNSPLPSTGLEVGCRWATMDDIRSRLFDLIQDTPNLDWLLLTKRPERWRKCWPLEPVPGHVSQNEGDGQRWVSLPNVWLGTSVEDQQRADERIPHLLSTPAAVRFLSCEPLLGPVEFSDVTRRVDAVEQLGKRALSGIHWVIVGSESGAGARPCNLDWVRSIRDQCVAAGVPLFWKQHVDGGRKISLPQLDGQQWAEFPNLNQG